MSDMKCPFCKEEIISDVCCIFDKENKDYTNGTQIYKCNKCGLFGNKELVQELIRTRKALAVAVDALKEYADEDNWSTGFALWSEDGTRDALYTKDGYLTAENALEQITALEQKDVK